MAFDWRLVLAAVLLSLASGTAHADPLRHLFLDPAFIRDTDKVTLRVNPPQRREIVLRPDRPWEGLMISLFLTVRDEGGTLRMWYICRDADNTPNLAYAESKDGVTWTKPSLGIVDFRGSKENNLVGVSTLEGAVFRDPHARTPAERYVYVAHVRGKGIIRHTSPDGLRWVADDRPLLPFRSDSQAVAFWDEREKKYALYLRGWTADADWEHRLRRVVRVTADSLATPLPITPSGAVSDPANPKGLPRIVSELPVVLAADGRDPPNTDVYNISAQPYPPDPRWYVGFPSLFRRERHLSDGRLEVHFVGSRDGVAWHRYDRTPYARPGLDGSESGNMVFLGTGLVVRGDEIWQYGTGFRLQHGDLGKRKNEPDGVVYHYVQRLDGFVSLDFDEAEGRCTTGSVRVDGGRLLLNVDTGALGGLRVGLLDADGVPVPGFGAAECEVVRINSTRAAVRWTGGGDLSAMVGREVRLAFVGTRTKLFGFTFGPEPVKASR